MSELLYLLYLLHVFFIAALSLSHTATFHSSFSLPPSVPHRYEVLFAPQPSAASCKFLTSIEMAFQHQVAESNERVMHQAERLKAEATSVAACEEQLQEIERCVLVFMRENAEPGSLSLAGIIVSALCALCR